MGPADLYVKSGSDINLTCKIAKSSHEQGNIFWYKGKDKSTHFTQKKKKKLAELTRKRENQESELMDTAKEKKKFICENC